MALTIIGQVAYYIIVCVTTITHFEPDQVFFVSMHLAKFQWTSIMQAHFEPEQAFSISMPQPVLNFDCLLKKHVWDPHRYICSL